MGITLVELITLLLACCGMTFTIVHAEIMDILKIRPFLQRFNFTKKLIKCSLCSGTYIGLLLGSIYLPWNYVIAFAFAGAGIAFIYERSVYLIDEHIIKIEKEKENKSIVVQNKLNKS